MEYTANKRRYGDTEGEVRHGKTRKRIRDGDRPANSDSSKQSLKQNNRARQLRGQRGRVDDESDESSHVDAKSGTSATTDTDSKCLDGCSKRATSDQDIRRLTRSQVVEGKRAAKNTTGDTMKENSEDSSYPRGKFPHRGRWPGANPWQFPVSSSETRAQSRGGLTSSRWSSSQRKSSSPVTNNPAPNPPRTWAHLPAPAFFGDLGPHERARPVPGTAAQFYLRKQHNHHGTNKNNNNNNNGNNGGANTNRGNNSQINRNNDGGGNGTGDPRRPCNCCRPPNPSGVRSVGSNAWYAPFGGSLIDNFTGNPGPYPLPSLRDLSAILPVTSANTAGVLSYNPFGFALANLGNLNSHLFGAGNSNSGSGNDYSGQECTICIELLPPTSFPSTPLTPSAHTPRPPSA